VSQRIACYLDAPVWLPAAGQGAIAVEIREDDTRMRSLLAEIHDAETWLQVRAERAFLDALEGGCQVPIGALAQEHNGLLTLYGLIADVLGRQIVRGEHPIDPQNPELTGIRLANELRGRGATEILESLRRAEQVPSPQPE
jgi:hydroxymethylbilane synthase